MPKRTGWAIVGEHGLYVGWWQTRTDAIAAHVRHYFPRGAPQSWGFGKPEREEWKRRRKRGDRAVKVTITYAS